MSGPERSQCLIFLVHEGSLEDVRLGKRPLKEEDYKGYAFLHVSLKNYHPRVCELLKDGGIEIINVDEEYPDLEAALTHDHVEVIELLLDENRSFYRCDLPPILSPFFLHVGVHEFNKILASELLPEMIIIHADKEFDRAKFRTVFDEENLASLEKLLVHRADIRIMHPKGGTLLHLAANKNLEAVVRILLLHGVSIDARRFDDGFTALHLAVKRGHTEISSLLLRNGACVEVADSVDGSTPLHTAALEGHLRIVEELLEHGANINSKTNREGTTPLCFATVRKHSEVVKLLLEKGANVDAIGCFGSVLRSAIFSECPEILGCVLSYRPSVSNRHNKSAFLSAIYRESSEEKRVIEKLLQYGFHVSAEDVEDPKLLLGAVRMNSMTLVQKIIEFGADIHKPLNAFSYKEVTPLHLAAAFADTDVIEFLLDHGADITVKCFLGRTPIFYAASNGQVNNLKLLLKFGATINATDGKCLSVLHVAAEGGFAEVSEFLLSVGADLNAKCQNDETPIFKAVSKGHLSAVETLLKYDAEINHKNKKGKTVLHQASFHGHTHILQTLLEYCFTDLDCLRKTDLFQYYNLSHCKGDEDIVGFYLSDNFEPCDKIFKRHVFKIYAINPRCEIKDELDYFEGEDWCEFRKACEAEISLLKTKKIGETFISVYDVLQSNTHCITRLLRNASVMEWLSSDDYKTVFPIHSSNLTLQFQKGMQRKELLKCGIKICRVLFDRCWDLPIDLEEKILNYLSNVEILILMTACSHIK